MDPDTVIDMQAYLAFRRAWATFNEGFATYRRDLDAMQRRCLARIEAIQAANLLVDAICDKDQTS
jgi:hypothetical protein